MSDREVLLALVDAQDDDGWTDSLSLAINLGFETRRPAAQRLSWLARYGAVERELVRDESGNIRVRRNGKPMHTQRWRMTPAGATLATGRLSPRQIETLDKYEDGQMVLVTRWLAKRQRTSDFTTSKLLSREYRYGTSPLREVDQA